VGIWKEWGVFYRFVRFDVGDGLKFKFCHDVWCEDQTLRAAFLELNSISRFKEASMANHLQYSNITFSRLVHDWEVELITSFFNLLYSF
jgi:hypothetical protein